jgi:Ca2+-binding EF-hand superfamily protein
VDLDKLKNSKGQTLKFQARLVTSDEIDATRVFRITWYLDDDTLAIYEPPQRNSGIIGGAFAARKKYTNPDSGKYFVPGDFFVGAVVVVNRFKLEIFEADDFSLRHMENKHDLWPMSSVEFVMENLKKKVQGQSASLRKMFRKFDLDHSQTISLEEFCNMLAYYGMGIAKQEALTIFRAFDKDRSGLLSYDDFVTALTDKDETGGVEARNARLAVDLDEFATEAEMRAYEARTKAAADEEEAESYLEKLLSRVAVAFRNSKAANILYQKFREFDENKDNTVDRYEFRMAMGSGGDGGHGFWNLSDRDVELLENKFFKGEGDSINYDEFIKVITDYADRIVRSQ